MSKMRFDVVQDAFKKKAAVVETPGKKVSDFFGELVFNRDKMSISHEVMGPDAMIFVF